MLNRGQIHRLAVMVRDVEVYPNPMFPPSLYYRFLKLLAKETKPDVSVELGVCGGGASLHMALGWPIGTVVGVDHRNQYPENIEHIKDSCSNFSFWIADSIEFAVRYPTIYTIPVDILFIDTVHTYDRTMAEFNAWQPLLAEDAVVILDDLFREGMQQAWDELPGMKIRLDDLHIGGAPTDGGFGVILLGG